MNTPKAMSVTLHDMQNPLFHPANLSRFFMLLLIWSLTPLAVVYSVKDLHPLWGFACRFAFAAPLAHVLVKYLGLPFAHHAQAIKSYCAGAIGLFGAMILTYLAAPHLPSAIISMLFGLSPLVAGLFGVVLFKQKMSLGGWFGILFALAGLFIALNLFGSHAHYSYVAVGLILLAMLLYVISMYATLAVNAQLHPLVQTTGSLWVSFLGVLLMFPLLYKHMPTHLPSVGSLIAIAFTVVFASIIAFVCYFDLNTRVSPTAIALTTVITPILATGWGHLFNHEVLGMHIVVGLSCIVLGISCYVMAESKKQYSTH